MNLTKTNWPLGWTPDADQANGNPGGLLRADNLQQDEEGNVTLVRGINVLNGALPDWVYKMYSRLINNTEYVWAALNISGSSVIRTSNNFGSFTTVMSGGGTKAAFGDCLGQVLISCGSHRVKDNGTVTKPLGLTTPTTAPLITSINQQQLPMVASHGASAFALVEGKNLTQAGDSAKVFVDDTTLRGVIETTFSPALDSVHFGIAGLNSNADPGDDLFTMVIQPSDTNSFTTFRIEFGLDGTYTNSYSYQWDVNAANFNLGLATQTFPSIHRRDFTRAGDDGTLDWTNVLKFRITMQATSANVWFLGGEQTFTGGTQGVLNSDYEYCAVAIGDNGIYVAKSGVSPISDVASIYNGYASIQLPSVSDSQITKIWLFRRSKVTNRPNEQVNLPDFYKVGEGAPGATITDNTTDNDALEQDIQANIFLQSLQDVPDFIYGMAGLFNERMLYITADEILLSDRINPDAIDQRYTVKAFGDPTEKNLFIKVLTNNTILLASTKDLYYISGTLLDQPDGTLDITIQAMGEAYPPLSEDFAFSEGALFYVAADGIRLTTGTNSIRLGGLDLLFREMTRYNVPPVALIASNIAEYSLTIGKGKLLCALPLKDGTRRLFVYTLATKSWRLQYTDPVSVYATQTDVLLLGYNLSANNNLIGGIAQLDSGDGVQSHGSLIEGQAIFFETVRDCNQQPRNRKDTFTAKIICDTGGRDCSLYVSIDKGTFLLVGTINQNGMGTSYFNMSAFTLGFRYAFRIVDNNLLTTFKLYELTLEYEPRPEQLNYLRILANNMGTLSRKRFITVGHVIDTLGNNVIFTPYIDNVAGTPQTFSTPTKQTYIYYFTADTDGIDVGGVFSGGPFEYYGISLDDSISEKMPPPTEYLLIPANNYGTPNRKRHTSYKFQINTRGSNVTFSPIVDGVTYQSAVFNTTKKQTVEYFFNTAIDVIGIDIGGILSSSSPFEFYGVITPQEVETLPPLLKSYYLPVTNMGTAARKRLKTLPIVINTGGANVDFKLQIDGVTFPTLTLNSTTKETFHYFFTQDSAGVDFTYSLISQGGPFEFYGLDLQDCVAETLPMPTEFLIIPPNNYDTPNRKRFTSYKFVIDARGLPVIFTPIVNGVSYTTLTFVNFSKQTVEYFFDTSLDITGIDIGGLLVGGPFEFYGPVIPQEMETLPARLESLYTPFTNFGSAARKRIRTIPFVINTNEADVSFTPNIDGVDYPAAIFNTSRKQTVLYYFVEDAFGIDIGGKLICNSPFEFYGFGTPVDVEVLPVPKKYDQFQPFRFDKIGKLFGLRIRLIMTGNTTSVPFAFYGDTSIVQTPASLLYAGTFAVASNVDAVYEVELPKNINGTILRLVLGPTADPFHRYDVQVKVSNSGMESDSRWVQLR